MNPRKNRDPASGGDPHRGRGLAGRGVFRGRRPGGSSAAGSASRQCQRGWPSRRAGSPRVPALADGGAHVSTAPPGSEVTGTLANGTTWVAEYPQSWNGTLVLYSHGYGALTAADAPDADDAAGAAGPGIRAGRLLVRPQRLRVGADTAVSDQFGALTAVESTVLPRTPAHVIAFGTSMGGLVSALEAQQGAGRIAGALTTCGVVAGGVNLDRLPARRRVRDRPAARQPGHPADRA